MPLLEGLVSLLANSSISGSSIGGAFGGRVWSCLALGLLTAPRMLGLLLGSNRVGACPVASGQALCGLSRPSCCIEVWPSLSTLYVCLPQTSTTQYGPTNLGWSLGFSPLRLLLFSNQTRSSGANRGGSSPSSCLTWICLSCNVEWATSSLSFISSTY